jgi:hypothetical protein
MGRPLVPVAHLLALVTLAGAPLAAQTPNVDSTVNAAMLKAEAGAYIGQVMSDTGVRRAMRHDRDARHGIEAALHEYRAALRYGNANDLANAKQTLQEAVKKATGRTLPDDQSGMFAHVPRIDVHVPGVNVHVDPMDVPVPAVPPVPPVGPAPPAAPAQPAVASSQTLSDSLKALVARARLDPGAAGLPPLEAFTAGTRMVSGETHGSVATVGGSLQVQGTVFGDVAAVAGDVVLLPGAMVHGNAVAIGGQVRQQGGTVDGEIRSTTGKIGPAAKTIAHAPHSAWHEFRLSVAFLALMLVIGVGVLTFASEPLDLAAQAVSEQFGRALGYGVVGAVAALPVLVIIIIAVCLTIIGILFTPVVLIGYTLVVLGIALVGFFAVAETTGRAVYRTRQALDPLSERGAKLRAIVTGIVIYVGLWVIAAICGGIPVLGVVLHVIASAITTIVLLVGFGAVLVSRRDARTGHHVAGPAAVRASAAPDFLWQTPTPVGGVAAARRPTPPPPSGPAS